MENCIDFWKTHPEVLVTGIHEPLAEETYKNRIPLLKVGDEKLFCLSIDAPGKLDLLHHLVCTVVQFLFGGDDAEQVQDECQQEHRYEDEHHRTEIVDITILTFQYGCRVLAGPALLGGCPAGCFGHSVRNCLWQSKTTAFLTKTAVSRNGKRLLYIFLTVPSIAWMPLRGKSRTVPMLCQLKIGKNFKAKKRIRRVLLLSAAG